MLLDEALNARGLPPANTAPYLENRNMQEKPNNEGAQDQNPINLEKRHNSNRVVARVDTRQENAYNCDEEYEV